VHDVLEHLEGRDRIPRLFGEARAVWCSIAQSGN
jgi:hypothetical protein